MVRGAIRAATVVAVAALAPLGCERGPPRRATSRPGTTPTPQGAALQPAEGRADTRVDTSVNTQIAGGRNESWFTAPRGIPPSDIDLTNQVRQALSAEPTLSPRSRNVTVSVNGGVVTLSGDVEDEQQRENLRAAVQRVAGVRALENRTTPFHR